METEEYQLYKQDFKLFQAAYIEFSQAIGQVLTSNIPVEEIAVIEEYKKLPADYSRSRIFWSLAEYHYYKAIRYQTVQLISDGSPKSAVRQLAKDMSAEYILIRIDSRELRKDLDSRIFKVVHEYNRLERNAYNENRGGNNGR